MKKLVLITASLFALQLASASSLIVEAIDGTTQVYNRADVEKLDFTTSGNMNVVKTDGTAEAKLLANTRKIVFSDADPEPVTSIAENTESVLKVYPNPAKNQITVEGAEDDILLFTASGKLVSKTKPADKAVVSVSSLAGGVYVLRSGKSAVRVIKSK